MIMFNFEFVWCQRHPSIALNKLLSHLCWKIGRRGGEHAATSRILLLRNIGVIIISYTAMAKSSSRHLGIYFASMAGIGPT